MKKFLLVSLLCALAIPALAEDRELTLEQRIEKLEQIIAEQNSNYVRGSQRRKFVFSRYI